MAMKAKDKTPAADSRQDAGRRIRPLGNAYFWLSLVSPILNRRGSGWALCGPNHLS